MSRGEGESSRTLAFFSVLRLRKSLICVLYSEAQSTAGEVGRCPALSSTGGLQGRPAKYFGWREGWECSRKTTPGMA